MRGTSLLTKLAWALVMTVGLFAIARGASVVSASMGLGNHAAAKTPPIHWRMHGPGVIGQVTAVSGNSISITAPDGTKYTVNVSSTTKYRALGGSASLSGIKTGDTIAVRGTVSGTTVTATGVAILKPLSGLKLPFGPIAGGTVTKVNGTSSITVSGFMSGTQTILIDANTTYERDGKAASLSDVTAGSRIAARGTSTSAGFKATEIDIITPRLAGTISKVNGSSFTLSTIGPMPGAGATSGTVTVNTSANTSYKSIGGSSASASSLKSGTFVLVAGTLSADGKTMNADRVTFLPAGLTPGKGAVPRIFGRILRHMIPGLGGPNAPDPFGGTGGPGWFGGPNGQMPHGQFWRQWFPNGSKSPQFIGGSSINA